MRQPYSALARASMVASVRRRPEPLLAASVLLALQVRKLLT